MSAATLTKREIRALRRPFTEAELAVAQTPWLSVCTKCGAEIEDMGGTTGWVDVVSGDDGGTYDICPEGPGLDDIHVPTTKEN